MWPFKKKRNTTIDISKHDALDDRIEILPHKLASEAAVSEAKEANKKLNKLLVENGFTLKIYLAAHPEGSKNRGK